jgi:hypothetical protein
MLKKPLAECSVPVAIVAVARGFHLALQQILRLSFAPWKNQRAADVDVQGVHPLGDTLREWVTVAF